MCCWPGSLPPARQQERRNLGAPPRRTHRPPPWRADPAGLWKGPARSPPELLLREAGISAKMIHFCRAKISWVDAHIIVPVKAHTGEGFIQDVSNRVRFARGDDIIARALLLEHHPPRLDEISGVAPD